MLRRFFTPRRDRAERIATIPLGRRVYAIGDVHGRLDLLDRLLAKIARDAEARPSLQTTLIFLGDLIDRGPESAAVVERVRALCIERPDTHCLCGNHEEILLGAYDGDTDILRLLLRVGGVETLCSYGLSPVEIDEATTAELSRMIVDRVPPAHVDFLRALEEFVVIGDYLFVHAGIRPGVSLDQQQPSDLRWIREPFLSHRGDHGFMVVHGHTITATIDTQPNRIGIDTGAFRSGRLTAIGMEGGERWFLDT